MPDPRTRAVTDLVIFALVVGLLAYLSSFQTVALAVGLVFLLLFAFGRF